MKKILLTFTVLFSLAALAQAQLNPHALGLRFGGDGSINGAEISYQHGLSDANRVELDLGFGASANHTRIFIVGIYHWNWNIDGGLNWYIGPGGSLGFFSYDASENYINIGVGGQIGLEYDFNTLDVPILVSVDARPLWDLLGANAGLGWGAAFGVRYTW